MGLLKEGKVTLYSGEASFLTFVQSDDFPWYFGNSTKNFVGMFHALMKRYGAYRDENGELKENTTPRRGIENSPHLRAAEDIFLRICAENNIIVRTVFRAAFNRTFHEPFEYGDIHIDHPFPHKNFILYVAAMDGGDTILFDEQANVEHVIKAEDAKFAVFDGGPHAASFCNPRCSRVVMIFTFDGDVNG